MRSVYKYKLSGYRETTISCRGVVMVGQDGIDDEPSVWVEHGFDNSDNPIDLTFFGTGHNVPDEWTHVGSCKCNAFVWHVYSKPGK